MFDSKTSIDDFVAATAARQPAPGGGSVTALVGALAAALGEMVLNYSVGKKGLETHQADLKMALGELSRARTMLLGFMVEDQAAYETLSAIRKLPADSPERVGKSTALGMSCSSMIRSQAATSVAGSIGPWIACVPSVPNSVLSHG